ncbi:Rho guanine nucleotide exchange factor 3/8 [Mytilus galloprovincialis]|uniref:Rho guanine nucleotide exchange factor 3/8 n=1 Tax=Mytilus galloprovincialis TaxID=29158 RepID=A0A8B6G7G6_MYTGA|nr:Rho guanine nucleotide exchange factor 3/8 [Mytilus galloprovincialis]
MASSPPYASFSPGSPEIFTCDILQRDPFNMEEIPEIKDVKSSRRHSIIGLASFDFPVLRKRKRKNADEDTISVQSLDVTVKKKSRKSLLRVSSIANLLSPSKSAKKGSETFQVLV